MADKSISVTRAAAAPCASILLAACGGGTHHVSLQASVSGLSGTGLMLQNTVNGDNLAVAKSGTSAFATAIANGGSYNVIVTAQPTNPSQTCVVANGSGTASAGSTVTVSCTTNTHTVSGVVTGLPDPSSGASLPLVLQDNGGNNITIAPTASSPIPFTFSTPVASGSAYSVTVQSQPGISTTFGAPGVVQTSTVCVVSAGTGTVTSGNITNVVVNCIRPSDFAYVTNSADNTVSQYIIDSAAGALLPSGPPINAGNSPSGAATEAGDLIGSNFLYVSNSGSSDLSGYTIDPNTGVLTPLSGSPFALGLSAPTSVATNGSALYVTNPGSPTLGAGSIAGFTIGTTGVSFTGIAGTPYTTQPGATAGNFFFGGTTHNFITFYLETNSASNTVSVYVQNELTGALTAVPNSPFGTGAGPQSVLGIRTLGDSSVEAYVSHVYVANSGDGTISNYSMDTHTGTLTPLQAQPTVNVGAGLSALTTDPSGFVLLATSTQGVSAFTTDSTGILVPVAHSPFAAGAGPGAIATNITANSNYIYYVVNTVDQTISVFTQDLNTNALTPVGGTAVKTGRKPSSIVVVARPSFYLGP